MATEAGPLTVDVQKLRRLLNALMDEVELSEGRHVDIDRDHYWLLELRGVFSEDLHEPWTTPDDFGVGQISDDVASVNELADELERRDAFLSLWHDLEHAVGLRATPSPR